MYGTSKVQLKDINSYLASYIQKLCLARERLDVIQTQIRGQVLNAELYIEERKIILEIEKWSSIEEQVLRQKSRATWI